MAAGVVLEFENVDASQYDAVNAKLNIDMATGNGDWPPGMMSHAGGPKDSGGFVVMEVWESQAAQEQFMNGRLGAALQEVGVPAPSRVTWFDVLGYQTP